MESYPSSLDQASPRAARNKPVRSLESHSVRQLKEDGNVQCSRKTTTTTPGYRPECTAPQTKTTARYDSLCCTHSNTLRRVRRRKEHSLIIAALQRQSGNAALLLWFYWLQAWNIILPSLVVTQSPTGRQLTHMTTPWPIVPFRGGV